MTRLCATEIGYFLLMKRLHATTFMRERLILRARRESTVKNFVPEFCIMQCHHEEGEFSNFAFVVCLLLERFANFIDADRPVSPCFPTFMMGS
jgi:hypothetical protein